ncbi:protein-tyrosine phosphatase-like protein [Pilobolus umbonatus]|nr:protein-tyrosine phosphatase-like protein [Pilobolus umbonatus]
MINNRKYRNTPLSHAISFIEPVSNISFLILDCPTETTLPLYIEEFKHHHVSIVTRCCQPTYGAEQLIQNNILMVDLPFKDGGIPPHPIINQWLQLIDEAKNQSNPVTIAVHCVAGLGRAPVLVAIALIELGMNALEAIEYIRTKRRGAFNKHQISFLLDGYKKRTKMHYFSLGRILGLTRSSPIIQRT